LKISSGRSPTVVRLPPATKRAGSVKTRGKGDSLGRWWRGGRAGVLKWGLREVKMDVACRQGVRGLGVYDI